MVRSLEEIELVAEGVGNVLEFFDFGPLLEFQEAPQSLHHERRIRKVCVVDAAVVPHDEGAQLQGGFAFLLVRAQHVVRQLHLFQQHFVRLETLEHRRVVQQVRVQHFQRPHHVLSDIFLRHDRNKDCDERPGQIAVVKVQS